MTTMVWVIFGIVVAVTIGAAAFMIWQRKKNAQVDTLGTLQEQDELQGQNALQEQDTLQAQGTLQGQSALQEQDILQGQNTLQTQNVLQEQDTLQTQNVLQEQDTLQTQNVLQEQGILQAQDTLQEQGTLQEQKDFPELKEASPDIEGKADVEPTPPGPEREPMREEPEPVLSVSEPESETVETPESVAVSNEPLDIAKIIEENIDEEDLVEEYEDPDLAYNIGKSGKRYTEEELELLIKE